MFKLTGFFISLVVVSVTFAAPGGFFAINNIGRPALLNITLCLNGLSPRTCQNYTISSLTLNIRTVTPNHTYSTAGIRMNTPGFTVANTDSGCQPATNGYCLFSVSDLRPKTIRVSTTTAATVLGSSVSNLALKIKGKKRTITIINTGYQPALNVTYTHSSALPFGTTITPDSCGTIAPSGSCVLTITPGSSPGSIPGYRDEEPFTLSIAGDNTNTLTPVINVLDYGSFYQGGYIFAIDDTKPMNESIGGKVMSLGQSTGGINWSAANEICRAYTISSTKRSPCSDSSVTETCYEDWYLPEICEMGYSNGGEFLCGNQDSPKLPNILSNLYQVRRAGSTLDGYYWSATEYSSAPQDTAWVQLYSSSSSQSIQAKTMTSQLKVLCVRSLTN